MIQRKSTHSKGGCPELVEICPYGRRLSCGSDRIGIFIYTCFFYRERQVTQQLSFQKICISFLNSSFFCPQAPISSHLAKVTLQMSTWQAFFRTELLQFLYMFKNITSSKLKATTAVPWMLYSAYCLFKTDGRNTQIVTII